MERRRSRLVTVVGTSSPERTVKGKSSALGGRRMAVVPREVVLSSVVSQSCRKEEMMPEEEVEERMVEGERREESCSSKSFLLKCWSSLEDPQWEIQREGF